MRLLALKIGYPADSILAKTGSLQHGLKLEDGLACSQAIYGPSFDPGTSLRALCSFRDGDLPQLHIDIQQRLIMAALAVNELPIVHAISSVI
jgi:hypothetical protein